MQPGWLEDREVLLVHRCSTAARPDYFIEIEFSDGGVASIRDYHHVPYIARDVFLKEPMPLRSEASLCGAHEVSDLVTLLQDPGAIT